MKYFFRKNLREGIKLRENYRRCKNRRKIQTKSGAGTRSLATCAFFKELSFLTDTVGNRPSQSNISTASEPISPAMLNIQQPAQYQEEVFHDENTPPIPKTPLIPIIPITPILPRNNKQKQPPTQRPSVDELLTEAIQSDINRSKEATHVPDSDE